MTAALIILGILCLASTVIFMCAARVGTQAEQRTVHPAEDNPTWLLQQLEDQFTPAEQGYAAVCSTPSWRRRRKRSEHCDRAGP